MTASNDLLEKLHAAVGLNLLERIESGEAAASDYAQAIKFLKDNDISASKAPTLDRLMNALDQHLPFTNPDDPTAYPH